MEHEKDQWRVFRRSPEIDWPELPGPLGEEFGSLQAWLERHAARRGQPFLIGPDGWADLRINRYFTTTPMFALDGKTWRKYAYTLGAWLNFLGRLSPSVAWNEATATEVANYKYWRMTDERNDWRVTGTTWHGDLAALDSFYSWAFSTYGVKSPVDLRIRRASNRGRAGKRHRDQSDHARQGSKEAEAAGVRDRDVKWFDRLGYRLWVDLGLSGVGPDGRDADGWRGRNSQRDTAFANLLYGTGLRLQEGGTLLIVELPELAKGRSYYKCSLAAACAKNKNGRNFWMPHSVRDGIDHYVGPEGERHRAVKRAKAAGRYDALRGLRIVESVRKGRMRLRQANGTLQEVPVDQLTPDERRHLFVRGTGGGLEPLALWLNEDGLPRHHHAWENTFSIANRRIKRLGVANFECTPHMLRHSFALFWYSIGWLLYERQYAHLSEEETKDFREEFGNVWFLVGTLMGHISYETTKEIYLEPFQHLPIDKLLEAGEDPEARKLIQSWTRDHDRVRTDPRADK